MTKADLVEQVAEAIGPGITKKDCALVVDGFLNAVKLALAEGENINPPAALIAHDLFDFFDCLSQTDHDPGLQAPMEVAIRLAAGRRFENVVVADRE